MLWIHGIMLNLNLSATPSSIWREKVARIYSTWNFGTTEIAIIIFTGAYVKLFIIIFPNRSLIRMYSA